MTPEVALLGAATITGVASVVTTIIARLATRKQLANIEHNTNSQLGAALNKVTQLEQSLRLVDVQKIAKMETEILLLRQQQKPPEP